MPTFAKQSGPSLVKRWTGFCSLLTQFTPHFSLCTTAECGVNVSI